MKLKNYNMVFCGLLVAGVLNATPSPAAAQSEDTHTTKPLRIALLADAKCTQKSSVDAIWSTLSSQSQMKIEKVDSPAVREPDFFDHFDVFILPGGTGGGEASSIGADAGKEIARRVHDEGKGLIAICAGGYYVAKGWNAATNALNIINVKNHDSAHWARGQQWISVRVTGENSDQQSSHTMWFENGPIFEPASIDKLPDYVSLAKYETDLHAKDAPANQMKGYDAIIAAPYGKGRVVAFGPHPERSPDVNHWLVNAVKWAARRGSKSTAITPAGVLEGN